ncbi:MAG: hypothetical protein B6U76_05770 [Desulfurococcales archaeon ex4484_217_2]|nr:MAG: hypothetical protein B6U76_05770 [Desulfurococcales archaeon ex4484_217_2]
MSSRVLGKGVCPKCGNEGSLVLKEISGKIYVYFKHGRKWCYIGPLSEVDLRELIFTLENYHSFTTKFKDFIITYGVKNMSRALMFILGISFILVAYSLSVNPNFSGIVLALTVLSTIAFSTLIASYELSPLPKVKYSHLRGILSKGLHYYLSLALIIIALVFIASSPLTSPYNVMINVENFSMKTSLSTLLLVSVIVVFLQRPLGQKGFTIYLIIPLTFMLLMFLPAIVVRDVWLWGFMKFAALATVILSIVTIAISLGILLFIKVLKMLAVGEGKL